MGLTIIGHKIAPNVRFDHHPEVGVDFLHPEFHAHSRGWQEADLQLPARPRIETKPVDMDFLLRFIVENFFRGMRGF
jgi:hypothetical protein